jgi:hypothetical protein
MQLPDFPTRYTADGIRLPGRRIGLERVVPLHKEWCSPEMPHEEVDTLPLALIHEVIAFYLES